MNTVAKLTVAEAAENIRLGSPYEMGGYRASYEERAEDALQNLVKFGLGRWNADRTAVLLTSQEVEASSMLTAADFANLIRKG